MSLGDILRESMSAGLSLVDICLQEQSEVNSWISATLFPTNMFIVLGGFLSHPNTIEESVQQTTWSTLIRKDSLIL